MSTITVSGYSDDLIEVGGDIVDEFDHYSSDPAELTFNDGTVLHVVYDDDGRWRISIKHVAAGTVATVIHVAPPDDPEDKDYTDKVGLDGDDLRSVTYRRLDGAA